MYLDSVKKSMIVFLCFMGQNEEETNKISDVFRFVFSLGKMKKKLQQTAQQKEQPMVHTGVLEENAASTYTYIHPQIYPPTHSYTLSLSLTHTHILFRFW